MASSITLKGSKLLPLWQRHLPKPPVYWKGDPQYRLFLPHWWVRIINPGYAVPNTEVHFETHPQMTSADIKQYLKKVYNIPVLHISTEVIRGQYKRHPAIQSKLGEKEYREPDRQMAYIQLGEGETFEFPEIKPEDERLFNKAQDLEREQDKVIASENKERGVYSSLPQWMTGGFGEDMKKSGA